MNRDLTMAEMAELPPLGLLPMGDDEWALVYPVAVVSVELGAVPSRRLRSRGSSG
jgi:hypothetical protein